MKRNHVLSTAMLMLLVAGLMPLAARSEKINQPLGSLTSPNDPWVVNTQLELKLPYGAPTPWGLTLKMFNSPKNITFHWRTKEPGAVKAIWQVSESPLGDKNTPAEISKVLPNGSGPAGAKSVGQYYFFTEFTIKFADLVPAKAPSSPKKYHVRVIPQNASGETVGLSSWSMLVTHVELGSISNIRKEESGTFTDVFFDTTTLMSPLVEASTKNPDTSGAGGPEFKNKNDVVSTGLPQINGPLHHHQVRLLNLMPCTFHPFVITATDKNGNKARKQDGFKTLCQSVQMTFEEVIVVDDSDDLSEGDITLQFTVGGFPGQLDYTSGIDSGERRALFAIPYTAPPKFLQRTITSNSKGPLMLNVLGIDDDTLEVRWPGALPTGGLPLSGDSAKGSTPLGIYVSGPDESFTQPFTLSALGSKLKFVVKGKFQVSYK